MYGILKRNASHKNNDESHENDTPPSNQTMVGEKLRERENAERMNKR
jgi:hypothetical protein